MVGGEERSCSCLGHCRRVLSLTKEKSTTAGRRWNFSSPGLELRLCLSGNQTNPKAPHKHGVRSISSERKRPGDFCAVK